LQKVKKALSKNYPILRLYKSDVEKIFNLFKDYCKTAEIVADGFKLDDFSELSKLNKQEIVGLTITAHDPLFFAEFSSYSAKIFLSDQDNLEQRGLADKIGEILSQRKSPLRFLTYLWMNIPFFAVFAFYLLYLLPRIKDTKAQWIILLGIILFYILLYICGMIIDTKKHSIIYLYDPSAFGFFKRNKDNILLVLLGAVAGGFITFIVTWILTKI